MARLQANSALTGVALFRSLADDLCRADIASAWLHERLDGVVNQVDALPAGYADAVLQSLVMADDGRAQLSLAVVDAQNWCRQLAKRHDAEEVVGFADGWTRIVFLSANDAELQLFTLDDDTASAQPPQAITAGDTIDLANDREALRFSRMNGDIVMLRLLVRDPEASVAVECDAATGRVLRRRQAQSHEGRTQMMVSLLRSLGRADTVPVIAEAISAWPPHLRWHGVREAIAMDSIAGTALLARLASSDPDAGVRALASRTCDDLIVRFPVLAQVA